MHSAYAYSVCNRESRSVSRGISTVVRSVGVLQQRYQLAATVRARLRGSNRSEFVSTTIASPVSGLIDT